MRCCPATGAHASHVCPGWLGRRLLPPVSLAHLTACSCFTGVRRVAKRRRNERVTARVCTAWLQTTTTRPGCDELWILARNLEQGHESERESIVGKSEGPINFHNAMCDHDWRRCSDAQAAESGTSTHTKYTGAPTDDPPQLSLELIDLPSPRLLLVASHPA
jgi:hypothetical protein